MKKIILSAAAALVLLTTGVSAASIKCDNGVITANGQVEGGHSGVEVVLQVIGPFDRPVADVEAAINVLAPDSPAALEKTYFNTVYTDEKGGYAFSYAPGKTDCFYAVAVKEPEEALETASLFLAPEQLSTQVLAEINGCKGEVELQGVFAKKEYENILINNYSVFQGINGGEARLRVFRQVIADKGTGFGSFAEFEKSLVTASAVQRIAESKQVSEAMGFARTYLEIENQEDREVFSKFSKSGQEKVFARTIGRTFDNNSAYQKTLGENIFLQKIAEEKYASNLTKLLTDNQQRFSLDLTGYSQVASVVNSKLMGQYYPDVVTFRTALRKAINDASGKKDSGSNSSGGGGGGGGDPVSKPPAAVVAPAGNTPQPTQTAEPAQGFTDLQDVAWAKEAIEALAQKQIISGREPGRFYPQDTIRREEAAKMIVSGFGVNRENARADLTDLDASAWYYPFVASGVEAGVIQGISDTEFGLGLNVSRQDLAVLLYRAALQAGMVFSGEPELFADDAQIRDYAKEGIYALKSAGILSGTGENCFEPERPATRAEAAKLIWQLLEVVQ